MLVPFLRVAQFVCAILGKMPFLISLIPVLILGGAVPVAKVGNLPGAMRPEFDGVFKAPSSADFNIFVVILNKGHIITSPSGPLCYDFCRLSCFCGKIFCFGSSSAQIYRGYVPFFLAWFGLTWL